MPIQPNLGRAALAVSFSLLVACEPLDAPGPAAVASAPQAASFQRIDTEADFREKLVGREVLYANGAVGTYGADKTWTITNNGRVVAEGGWTWREDRWCYGGSTDEGPIQIRCEEVAVSDAGVRYTREDGSVEVLPFRL